MIRSFLFLVAVSLAGCSSSAPPADSKPADSKSAAHHDMEGAHHDHGEMVSGGALMISTKPAKVEAGKPTELALMIHDASGEMVTQFETVHEKRLHLIIVREGLDHFDHVHPDIDAEGNITITHTFPVGGKYFLYADHKPAGKPQAIPSAEIDVAGENPTAPKLVANVPGKVSAAGLNADIAAKNPKAGGAADITFTLTDSDGKAVTDLEPYLGAMGHLVVLSADGKKFVHAHPEANAPEKNVITFMAHFTAPGIYKGWGQFQRAGKVITIPFVLNVAG